MFIYIYIYIYIYLYVYIYIYTYIYIIYIYSLPSPVGGMCVFLNLGPGCLRVLRSILAVPSTALVVPGICWSHSSSSGVTKYYIVLYIYIYIYMERERERDK